MIRFASALTVAACLVLPVQALAQSAPPPASPDASLTFTVDVGAQTGAVMVVLYNSQSAFDGGEGQPVGVRRIDIAAGEREAVFPHVPQGDYAAKMFHDVDGDGEMDTNPFGLPTEPYAFSNNARGNMGPARWDRAHLEVRGAVAQTIALK